MVEKENEEFDDALTPEENGAMLRRQYALDLAMEISQLCRNYEHAQQALDMAGRVLRELYADGSWRDDPV